MLSQKGFSPLLVMFGILLLAAGVYVASLYMRFQTDVELNKQKDRDYQQYKLTEAQKSQASNLIELITYKLPDGWRDSSNGTNTILLTSPDYYVGQSGGMEKGKSFSISRRLLKAGETLDSSALEKVWDNVSEKEKESQIIKTDIDEVEGRLAYDNYEGHHQHYLVVRDNYLWEFEANLDKGVSLNIHDSEIDYIVKSLSFTH